MIKSVTCADHQNTNIILSIYEGSVFIEPCPLCISNAELIGIQKGRREGELELINEFRKLHCKECPDLDECRGNYAKDCMLNGRWKEK